MKLRNVKKAIKKIKGENDALLTNQDFKALTRRKIKHKKYTEMVLTKNLNGKYIIGAIG